MITCVLSLLLFLPRRKRVEVATILADYSNGIALLSGLTFLDQDGILVIEDVPES